MPDLRLALHLSLHLQAVHAPVRPAPRHLAAAYNSQCSAYVYVYLAGGGEGVHVCFRQASGEPERGGCVKWPEGPCRPIAPFAKWPEGPCRPIAPFADRTKQNKTRA